NDQTLMRSAGVLAETLQHLEPVGIRHLKVQYHDLGFVFVNAAQALAPIPSLDHFVLTRLAQKLPQHVAERLVVVDYEHARAALRRLESRRLSLRQTGVDDRNRQIELRASAELAVEPHFSAQK